jgi:hypothetical protein
MILDSVRNNLLASELSAIARNYIEFAEQFDAFSLPMSAMLRVPPLVAHTAICIFNRIRRNRSIYWMGTIREQPGEETIPDEPKRS